MESRTWIDDLVGAKVLMFMLLFAFIYLGVVLLFYPLILMMPFKSVTERELAAFQSLLGADAAGSTVEAWGDWAYDGTFVTTGAERSVYGWLRNAYHTDIPLDPRIIAMMADNFFDYLLTVAYRIAFLALLFVYLGTFVACTVVHALIGRLRARYTFGDTPLIPNIYARAVTLFSLALSFIILFWPGYVHPLLQASMLTLLAAGVSFLWASLPKAA